MLSQHADMQARESPRISHSIIKSQTRLTTRQQLTSLNILGKGLSALFQRKAVMGERLGRIYRIKALL